MDQLWAVVLAAGKGKRMQSSLPKVLHPLCGRPMLHYILDSAQQVADQTLIVIGHAGEQVRQAIGPEFQYVVQQQQLGTGHAMMQALKKLPAQGRVLVLCGDTPLLDSDQLNAFIRAAKGRAAAVMTVEHPQPSGYGRVLRDGSGILKRIVEERDATAEEKEVAEINTGTYCFDIQVLKQYLPLLSTGNNQGEYYLPDVFALMIGQGLQVAVYRADDYRTCLGINDRCQLAEVELIIRNRINSALMRQGVTMLDPATTYVDYGVQVAPDTVLYPNTILQGSTAVGPGCRIGPGAHLVNARLAGGVIVRQSVIEDSRIEADAVIGPFSYIRPGSHIGPRVKIGDFVEVKNSNIGEGSKVPHLSYVGDADIGSGVNIGAGVIFVNYDGRRKHRSVVESGSFIGCNSNLISPLKIGEQAYVAAGSTVTVDVPPGALATGRSRQENRPGLGYRLLKKKQEQEKEKGNENE